jgi:hypothetical protein
MQEARDQISELAVETAHLSNLVVQTIQAKSSPDVPSRELLRLRGEVARLHRDLEELAQESHEGTNKVREQNRQTADMAFPDIYGTSGIDTNGVPNIKMSFTTNEVLAELRRVGANLLNVEEDYIRAEIFPTMVVSTNCSLLGVRMQLWFEGGTLTSRRIFRTADLIANQQ